MAICKYCGAQVAENVKFCTACGATLEQPAPAPAAYQQQPVYAAPAPAPARPVDDRPAKGSDYAPIGTFGYIGYFILFAIPILGQILCIIWAFGKNGGNVNRRSLARAVLVFLIVGLIAGLTIGIAARTAIRSAAAAGNEAGIFSIFQGLGQRNNNENTDPENNNTGEGGDNYIPPEGGDGVQPPADSDPFQNTPPTEFSYGGDSIFTANWPNNEFTKQVPKPNFEVSVGSVNETEFVAIGGGATVEQLRAYAKQLERSGFNKDKSVTDESAFGFTTYFYKAHNGRGYEVEISYVSMMNLNSITIRKLSPMS